MNIDTFLTIGKTHKVCEDYILSGTEPIPYIIISDGCSSSKQTDMGARLLCFLAQQYLKFRVEMDIFEPDHNEMGMWIIHNAELVAKQLGLSRQSLDATLIIAYQNRPDNIRVHMYGDGCMLEFYADGGYVFTQVDYSQNAPYYLSYQIDPVRHKAFHEMNQSKIYTTWFQNVGWESTTRKFDADIPYVINCDLNSKENRCTMAGLLIASDGFISFMEDKKPGIKHILDYASDFYLFKTTAGEFLKRRATMALRNLAKENIHNADDLSIGVFLKEDK